MRLIAFFGPSGSGKDEAAHAIACLSTGDFIRIEFAEPIRWACDALGLPGEATRGRKDEPCAELDGHRGRAALVGIGEATRDLAPLYFVKHALDRARSYHVDIVAISDGRTGDEARGVREAGGLCVWVDRPSARPDAVVQPAARALCHLEIDNSGDLDHLRAECQRVLAAALAMPEVAP